MSAALLFLRMLSQERSSALSFGQALLPGRMRLLLLRQTALLPRLMTRPIES